MRERKKNQVAFRYVLSLCTAVICFLAIGFHVYAEQLTLGYGRFVYNKNIKKINGSVISANPENITLSVTYDDGTTDHYSEPADVLYIGNKDDAKYYRVEFTQSLTKIPASVTVSDCGTVYAFDMTDTEANIVYENGTSILLGEMVDPLPVPAPDYTDEPDESDTPEKSDMPEDSDSPESNTGSEKSGNENTGAENNGTRNSGSVNPGSANQGNANQGSVNQGSVNPGSVNPGSGSKGTGTAGTKIADSPVSAKGNTKTSRAVRTETVPATKRETIEVAKSEVEEEALITPETEEVLSTEINVTEAPVVEETVLEETVTEQVMMEEPLAKTSGELVATDGSESGQSNHFIYWMIIVIAVAVLGAGGFYTIKKLRQEG